MSSLVRLLAIALAAVVGLSFLFFALDQSSEGRDSQLRSLQGSTAGAAPSKEDLGAPNPAAPVERVREREHSSLREAIDDGNDVLVSPFTGVVSSDSIWIQRVVTAVIGLLLFGLGGLMLASWIPEKRTEHRDWREPAA